MTAFGPRAGGLRLIRIVLVAVAVGVTLNSAASVVLWHLNTDRVDQINQERVRNTLASCLETNARHDRTILRLRMLVDQMPPGPQKARAERGIQNTIELIDALAPQRDCLALVRRQIKSK